MAITVTPTGAERVLAREDIIVTKTDLKGRLTYTNDVFLKISAVEESEALGKPHNIIRHPDMPAGVYKLLWESITAGSELFAFVKNLAFDGAHYWVIAHVTPSYNKDGVQVGYHSMRRSVEPQAIARVEKLYAEMKNAEFGLSGVARAEASYGRLQQELNTLGVTYSQWVWQIVEGK